MLTRRRRTNSNPDSDEKSGSPHVNRTYVSEAGGYGNIASGQPVAPPPQSVPSPPRPQRPDPDMTCRDRTNEFATVVKSLQSRQVGNGVVPSARSKALQQRGEFMLIARKIGHDISSTFAKLEKLTILAKRKSLFDDKPEEIQQLTFIIKQDISLLNEQIARLQELSKAQRHQNGRH